MFRSFLSLLSALPRKYPYLVIAAVILLFITGMFSAKYVRYDQGVETYFSEDKKEYVEFKMFSRSFGGSESAYILVKGDDVLNPEVLEYMLALEKELRKIPGVTETDSPASQIVKSVGFLPQDETLLKELARKFGGNLIPKKTLALINVRLDAKESEYNVIAEEMDKKINLVERPPGVTAEATGSPLLRYQIEQAIGGSMKIMFLASLVLMVLILFSVFRGIVSGRFMVFAPLLLALITSVLTFGLMPLLNIPLTEVTNGFLPVLIGLSIEYAVQFQSRYEEERRAGNGVNDAIKNAVDNTGQAIVLAMVTTVIGFLSMYFSGVPALGYFGLTVSIGLIIAFFLTLTVLPSFYKISDSKEKISKKAKKEDSRLYGAIAKGVSGHPKTVIGITILLVVLGGYGYANVELQTDFMKYVPQDLPAIQRLNELQSITGSQDFLILVLSGEDVLSPKFISDAEKVAKYIDNAEDDITGYDSPVKTLSLIYPGLTEEQLISLVGSMPDTVKNRYFSGKSLMAIYFKVSSMDWLKFSELYNRVKEEVKFAGFPGRFYLTGDVALKMFISDLIINGQKKMTVGSYLLVFFLLLFVYRSFSKAIIPLIAISTVIAVVGGVMYAFDIPKTLVSASLNSVIIGLGIDFSIHISERYREERKRGRSSEEAVYISTTRIGRAITTSALTMAGGFGAILFSSFPIMRTFGLISLVAIIFSLIAAITIVPALLVFSDRIKDRREKMSVKSS